jgi:class 3 adenylate cyclase
MASMMVADHDPAAERLPAGYEVLRRVEGAALFLDVRGSSRIVDFIERHHGPDEATALFMRFLSGCLERIDGPSVDWCAPSGDAVLATFTGPRRIRDAVDAAWRAVRFVQVDFTPRNQPYLSCDGDCDARRCPGRLRFDVGAGIDDGIITVTRLPGAWGHREELVGSCVSIASKLSGRVRPPNSIGVIERAYQRGQLSSDAKHLWRTRISRIGGRYRRIMLTGPPSKVRQSAP